MRLHRWSGIDVAVVRVSADVSAPIASALPTCCIGPQRTLRSAVTLESLASATVPWDAGARDAIIAAIQHPDAVVLKDLGRLNFLVGDCLATAVKQVVTDAGMSCADIDVVASHGTAKLAAFLTAAAAAMRHRALDSRVSAGVRRRCPVPRPDCIPRPASQLHADW